VTRAAVKPYPWCASIHSPIDAMLRLVRSHDLSSAGIDEVVVANSDTVLRQCGFTYQERYSKPHVIEKKKSARAASNASW
jgi:2-methylcitrate dehydratase PrpD